MAFHTNAKRPASGNVWERLRERGAPTSARSRPSPGGEGAPTGSGNVGIIRKHLDFK